MVKEYNGHESAQRFGDSPGERLAALAHDLVQAWSTANPSEIKSARAALRSIYGDLSQPPYARRVLKRIYSAIPRG